MITEKARILLNAFYPDDSHCLVLDLEDTVIFAGVNRLTELGASTAEVLVGRKMQEILSLRLHPEGIDYFNDSIKNELQRWNILLRKYIGKCTMSFDNLAIEQLNVKKLFTIEGWEKFYMGDDFCFTMYIDAVKQEYAPTSRSLNRKSFNEISLINYFISESRKKIK